MPRRTSPPITAGDQLPAILTMTLKGTPGRAGWTEGQGRFGALRARANGKSSKGLLS